MFWCDLLSCFLIPCSKRLHFLFVGKLNVRSAWLKDEPEKKTGVQELTLKNGKEVSFLSSGKLQVSVTDTGAGLSADQSANLFRNGIQFNVNELQAGQGSGLGLYIAKGIVEEHGGTLVAYSEGLGEGTTFTMTLPLFKVLDNEPAVSDIPAADERYGLANLPRTSLAPVSLRLLIVDDAGTNRKLLKRLLENHGHKCDEAEDGRVAVDKVVEAMNQGKMYDTVLLDYEMPIMNGPQAAKEMRALGCDSFIVGITGNVMAEDVTFFKACGANAVLPKPFKLSELDHLWAECLAENGKADDSGTS
jgi:CheY-like chemotaxis protein